MQRSAKNSVVSTPKIKGQKADDNSTVAIKESPKN